MAHYLRYYCDIILYSQKTTDIKKYLAELVGTFTLTFLGCAAAVSLNCSIGPALFEGGKALSDIWDVHSGSPCGRRTCRFGMESDFARRESLIPIPEPLKTHDLQPCVFCFPALKHLPPMCAQAQ